MSDAIADVLQPGWAVQPLDHNPLNAATGGIWRVRRNATTAILKILWPGGTVSGRADWATSDDPGHWNYWRREGLAYRTGLCAAAFAAGGIRPPRLLDSVDRYDGSIALWLEDVDGTPGTELTIAQFGDLARRLGTAHASWLAATGQAGWPGQPAPVAWLTVDWLSRDWLRDYTLSRPVADPVAWDHPLAAQVWPAPLRATLREIWERRHRVLAEVDLLPVTLCHHDVWPMNLVVDDAGPVLFDWTFVGPGAIGEDPANLILDTFFDGLVPIDGLPDVRAAVCDGYARGLAGALEPDDVHRAIRLSAAAKYFWLAPFMLNRIAAADRLPGVGYDARDDLAILEGRRPVLELLTDWYRTDHPR
ncbi:phosphotransferase [Luedemannella flava]|uniref:phosphotransferase n=1 Tax=Luedemannella flava TaxID=349316 RepID=UPI0031DD8D03